MNGISKFQIYMGFLAAIIALGQGIDNFGEKMALSYFFLSGGVLLFVLNFVALYKKVRNSSSTSHNDK